MALIKVENLGKKYLLTHQEARQYVALRDVIMEQAREAGRFIANPFGSRGGSRKTSKEEFWALRDVSFEVEKGDRLGVIGRNGAGKSTLLKILSRITEPTSGRVTIRGRMASLLEVGTGFHPELTGRENIYLNGAILGMKRTEIASKFDEIVAFAEVERFLDTPVKQYSSGMYVRLAFAVAAHLEPEILVVDEVLAVGDAEFQKKCMGKMESVGREGRTILFVSHNMNAVEQLCNRCILLNFGKMEACDSDVRSVIKRYLFSDKETESSGWSNPGNLFQNQWFKPVKIYLSGPDGKPLAMPADNSADMWFVVEAEIAELDPALTVGYAIYSEEGSLLYWSYQTDGSENMWPKLAPGDCRLRGRIPKRLLNEGSYRIELIGGLHFKKWLFEPGVTSPAVHLRIHGGLSDSPLWMIKRPGLLAPIIEWRSDCSAS